MKKLHARELSRNQPMLRFDFILQHDWPIEQCLLHIRVFVVGKTKSSCCDLFIHWLIKEITNTYRNHFSRSYENRSIFLHIHDFFTSGRKGSRADEEEPDLGISYEVLPAGAGEMPEVRTLMFYKPKLTLTLS